MQGGTIEGLNSLSESSQLPDTPCDILQSFGIVSFQAQALNIENMLNSSKQNLLKKVPEVNKSLVNEVLNSL